MANVVAGVCSVQFFCFIQTGNERERGYNALDNSLLMMTSAGDCHGIEGASARAAGRLTHCFASRTQSSCCLHFRRPCPGATSCDIVPVLTSPSLPVLPLHSSYCLLVTSLSSYNFIPSLQPEECALHRLHNDFTAASHMLRQSQENGVGCRFQTMRVGPCPA